MSKSTEWLLRCALGVMLVYFAWALSRETIVNLISLGNQVTSLSQQLQHCKVGDTK